MAATSDKFSSDIRNEPDAVLLLRYQRQLDIAAREELVRRHLALVKRLARRYGYTTEPLEDLVQVGSVALLRALDRYDATTGSSFVAYAIPTIVGELRRHFRDHGWSVRVPRALQERSRNVQNAMSELAGTLGRSPTIHEVAEKLGLTSEEVIEGYEARLAYRAGSLDAPASEGDEESRPARVVRVTAAEDDGYRAAEDAAMLDQARRLLSVREREILRLRFEEDLSQSEIGERLGISQMHVSRLLRRSLERMGTVLREGA
jgi:RNA polymerase sigma-B factor